MSDVPDDDLPDQPSEAVDAGDEAGVRKQRVNKKLKENKATVFWRQCFSTAIGRQQLYQILKDLGTFNATQDFPASPSGTPDARAHQHYATRRDFGMQLFHLWMLHDRQGFLTMLDENDPTYIARKKGT